MATRTRTSLRQPPAVLPRPSRGEARARPFATSCRQDNTPGRDFLSPTSRQGSGLRAVLVEREAAERRLDPTCGAVRGLGLHRGGGSTRGSRSSEPATATSAARWHGLRWPGRQPLSALTPPHLRLAPPLHASSRPLLRVPRTRATERAGSPLPASIGLEPMQRRILGQLATAVGGTTLLTTRPQPMTWLAIGRRRVMQRLQATW